MRVNSPCPCDDGAGKGTGAGADAGLAAGTAGFAVGEENISVKLPGWPAPGAGGGGGGAGAAAVTGILSIDTGLKTLASSSDGRDAGV